MTTLTFDIPAFRLAYPEFADPTTYPDALLQQFWDTATCYLSPDVCPPWTDTSLRLALNLFTAHLTQLSTNLKNGKLQNGTIVQGATVDKVTISLVPPPLNDSQFQWWLSTTAYGAQLLSLLSTLSVGGFYFNGFPNQAAFKGDFWYW